MTRRFFIVVGLTTALLLVVAPAAWAEPASRGGDDPHRVHVQVEGPLATVTVDRTLLAGQHRVRAGASISIFDLALPRGARGLRVEIIGPPRGKARPAWKALQPDEAIPPAAVKAEADPQAQHRIVLDGWAAGDEAKLQYSFIVPLSCRGGRWGIDFPGATDLSPIQAAVTVAARLPSPLQVAGVDIGGTQTRRNRAGLVQARAPAQAAWRLELEVVEPNRPTAASLTALGIRWPNQGQGSQAQGYVGLCRAVPEVEVSWPRTVVVAVDSSRSVGAAGLSLERETVQALLETFPAGTRWNAVLFDRNVRRSFPVLRLLTSESMSTFADSLVPGILANGTDVASALVHVGRVLREDDDAGMDENQVDERQGRWVVLVTDGATGEPSAERLLKSRVQSLGSHVRLLTLVVRPEGEETPPEAATGMLSRLSHFGGGLMRVIPSRAVKDAARNLVTDVRRGGDAHSLRAWPPVGWTLNGEVLPPGAGGGAWVKQQRDWPRRLQFQVGSSKAHTRVRTLWTSQPWPLEVLPVQPLTVELTGGRRAFWNAMSPTSEGGPAGELERSVLKNSLALSYLPRARACYLNRNVPTPTERARQGRVRLVMELERGEMVQAYVMASSLEHKQVEACLVEAAYALTVPRPAGRDAPVQAILNLVFRPATAGEPEAFTAFTRELEILLSPITRAGQTTAGEPDAAADLRLLQSPAPSAPPAQPAQ